MSTMLHGGGGELAVPFTDEWYKFVGLATLCTCFAGICSGLTVGLLSIDVLDLEIKLIIGTEAEKRSARNI